MNKFAGVQLPKSMIDSIPKNLSGIYILYQVTGKIKKCSYIGESGDIQTRLKDHPHPFDSFSYCKFHPEKRSFIEQFLIKSLDFIPGEEMNVFIENEKYEIDEPQFVNGSKRNPKFKSS